MNHNETLFERVARLRADAVAKTVESHRAEVMNRLGIRTIAGLVRYAIWTGLVPLEPAMASSMVGAEAGEAQTLLR